MTGLPGGDWNARIIPKALAGNFHKLAGNDGTGAVREIDRIARGYGWKTVAEPLIVRKGVSTADLLQAEALGEAMAAGLAMGVF